MLCVNKLSVFLNQSLKTFEWFQHIQMRMKLTGVQISVQKMDKISRGRREKITEIHQIKCSYWKITGEREWDKKEKELHFGHKQKAEITSTTISHHEWKQRERKQLDSTLKQKERTSRTINENRKRERNKTLARLLYVYWIIILQDGRGGGHFFEGG